MVLVFAYIKMDKMSFSLWSKFMFKIAFDGDPKYHNGQPNEDVNFI